MSDSFQPMDYRPPRWVRAPWKRPTLDWDPDLGEDVSLNGREFAMELYWWNFPEIHCLTYQGKLFTGISYQRHPARKPEGALRRDVGFQVYTVGSGGWRNHPHRRSWTWRINLHRILDFGEATHSMVDGHMEKLHLCRSLSRGKAPSCCSVSEEPTADARPLAKNTVFQEFI